MAQQPKTVETQLPMLSDAPAVDATLQDTTNADEIKAQADADSVIVDTKLTDADVTSTATETKLAEAEATPAGDILNQINDKVTDIKEDLDKIVLVEDTAPFTGAELIPAMWNIERKDELIVATCGSRVFKGTVQAFNKKFK